MSCPSFETLSRFVDDALPAGEIDAVSEHVGECMACTKATGRLARMAGLVSDAALGGWEPAGPPEKLCPSPADMAGWSAGGRSDVDEHVAACPRCLARAVDLFRALAAKDARAPGPVPADAMPERGGAPAAAAAVDAPKIRLRGYPGFIEILGVPEGVKVEEDGHVKAFSWKAGNRFVSADLSASGGGIGVRIRVRENGAAAGGIPVNIADTRTGRSFSHRPTDVHGEVLVRDMPLHPFRIEVADTPVDVAIEA